MGGQALRGNVDESMEVGTGGTVGLGHTEPDCAEWHNGEEVEDRSYFSSYDHKLASCIGLRNQISYSNVYLLSHDMFTHCMHRQPSYPREDLVPL